MSRSRSNVLAVSCSTDPVLHYISPLGLAAAAGTAVVVDLDADAITYPGTTMAALRADGPRSVHLRPARRGVAVLGNGGITLEESSELISALCAGWPAVVLRVGPTSTEFPTVQVCPLLPAPFAPGVAAFPRVFQQVFPPRTPPGPGIVVPALGRGKLDAMFRGQISTRWRWVQAWARVWEVPWP